MSEANILILQTFEKLLNRNEMLPYVANIILNYSG